MKLIRRVSSQRESKRLLKYEKLGDQKLSQFLIYLQNLANYVVSVS